MWQALVWSWNATLVLLVLICWWLVHANAGSRLIDRAIASGYGVAATMLALLMASFNGLTGMPVFALRIVHNAVFVFILILVALRRERLGYNGHRGHVERRREADSGPRP